MKDEITCLHGPHTSASSDLPFDLTFTRFVSQEMSGGNYMAHTDCTYMHLYLHICYGAISCWFICIYGRRGV